MKSIFIIALSFFSVHCRLYELSDSSNNCLSNSTCNVQGTNDYCCGLATIPGKSYNYTSCLSVEQANTTENFDNYTYYF